MDAPNSAFTIGQQPCAHFCPQRDGNGYASWDNRHQCFHSDQCAGMVSFCLNCNSDHHSYGYDKCGLGPNAACYAALIGDVGAITPDNDNKAV